MTGRQNSVIPVNYREGMTHGKRSGSRQDEMLDAEALEAQIRIQDAEDEENPDAPREIKTFEGFASGGGGTCQGLIAGLFRVSFERLAC